MEASFFSNNRQVLYQSLPEAAVFVICSGEPVQRTADEMYRFFANRSFVYLTGVEDPQCILMAWRLHGEVKECLFIREPDPLAEAFTGARITAAAAEERSSVVDIRYLKDFEQEFHRLAGNCYFTQLHLPLENNLRQELTDQNRAFSRFAAEKYPSVAQVNAFPGIAAQRMHKTPGEIAALRKAIKITGQGVRRMMARAKTATREMDLYAEWMQTLYDNDMLEPGYRPIVSCGENNFSLHYDTPVGPACKDGLFLVDVGAMYDYCCADISRVFPQSGHFSQRQRQVYELSLQVNDAITAHIKPGMPFARIDEMCREKTFEGLRAFGLIDDIRDIGRYVWHGCSHHIGFDVHDVGTCHIPIAENMTFSMDTGIYIKEWGIGLRIEDDVLVTAEGLECLSKDIPRTVDEVEAAMAQ